MTIWPDLNKYYITYSNTTACISVTGDMWSIPNSYKKGYKIWCNGDLSAMGAWKISWELSLTDMRVYHITAICNLEYVDSLMSKMDQLSEEFIKMDKSIDNAILTLNKFTESLEILSL